MSEDIKAEGEDVSTLLPVPAFLDDRGWFHCSCGATHRRGAVNGVDVYRCMKCGKSYRIEKTALLR